jgi:glutaredoxin-like protein
MTQQSVISDQQKAQLKRTLRKDLKAAVNLRLFTQTPSPIAIPGRECPSGPQTRQLLEEVAELSPKLNLAIIDFYNDPEAARKYGVARIPALLLGEDTAARLKFYGIPLGYQMAVIIESIRTISRGVSPLSMDSRRKLRQVNQPVHIQVMATPQEANSAEAARLAFALALENRHISADAVNIQAFPALARNYGVQTAPTTVINEYVRLAGPVTEAALVEQALTAGVRRPRETAGPEPSTPAGQPPQTA